MSVPNARQAAFPISPCTSQEDFMTLKPALLAALMLASTSAARTAPSNVISGRLYFINDAGAFMLDIGIDGIGNTISGKMTGIKAKEGSAAAIRKLIPTDARLQFKVTKASSYPEGQLLFNGRDLAAWLVSKGLATRLK